jgi:hypothetical protein
MRHNSCTSDLPATMESFQQIVLEFPEHIKLRMLATIEQRFQSFHSQNPQVYEALVALAHQAKAHGKTRVGIKALWERMRWDLWLQTDSDEEFTLNNSFTSRYARLIAQREPDLADLFEFRRLRAA